MAPSVEPGAEVVTFDVMSCRGRVLVAGGADPANSAERAVDHLEQLEQRWSRFVPTSEISRLNAAAGEPTEVSADTVTLVEHLIEAQTLTGGAFDPTLLRPIIELGYATSRSDARRRSAVPDDVAARGSVSGVVVDHRRSTITLPLGTALDPGGLGKGLSADLVVAELMRQGASGCLVEVGGDLRVAGAAPGGHAWTIAVDGDDGPPLLLASGGLATSSSRRRTWQLDGRLHHHLLDPVTLQPTDHGVVECSVAVGSAAHAEALTKVAFVRGLADGVGFYADRGIAARVVDADGSIVTTPAWRDLQGATR